MSIYIYTYVEERTNGSRGKYFFIFIAHLGGGGVKMSSYMTQFSAHRNNIFTDSSLFQG
jgi:hypothetical protein